MSSEVGEETLEEEEQRVSDDNEDLSQEWETMARAWLCSFPEPIAVSMTQVEAWIDSNHDSLPIGIKSMPRSDLSLRLISIQNMRLPNQTREEEAEEPGHVDNTPQARFQRTDQWRPVYSWLEGLEKDEVVKSKDISDWLAANPNVQDELCSRHSRYHLMHYIKKCHMKILKRNERKKGFQRSEKPMALKVNKDVGMKLPATPPPPITASVTSLGSSSSLAGNSQLNQPKDNDMLLAKRKEAFQKYEILVELEKLIFPALKRQELSR